MTTARTKTSTTYRLETALDEVRLLSRSDDGAKWDAFVRGDPNGTFYHLSGWRRLIGDLLGHPVFYLYVERAGKIEGVLPLARVKSWLFSDALISVPYLVYGGPVAQTAEAEEALIDYSVNLAEDLGVDYLELRNQAQISDDWLTKKHYATFRKAMDPEPEKNLLAIPRKQRAMIRKGIKLGLEAEIDKDTNRLYSAMLACKRNLGTPFFGASWLQAIKDEFNEQVEIMTVTRDDQLVCSVLSFRFRDEILPYYGGGGDLARTVNGNDFMYWKVMEKACSEGVRVFDYGRSMVGSGAYRFKKHWGFEPEPLEYQYHLVNADSVPNVSPTNRSYKFLIGAWKRLPLPIAGSIGPRIARLLG